MLYWIETDIDFSRLVGSGGQGEAAAVLQEETGAWRDLHARQGLLRIWRRINGRGVHAVVDFMSPQALDDWLGTLPTWAAMQGIDITPMREHKIFDQFARWREAPGAASGQLHLVRLEIDRARLEAARDPGLIVRAEANARRHVDQGQVLGIWRLLHGNGARITWHSADHGELHHELDTLPAKPWLRAVHVEPMVALAGLEHLAGWC